MTERGDERPGGARSQAARSDAREASRGRVPRVAEAWVSNSTDSGGCLCVTEHATRPPTAETRQSGAGAVAYRAGSAMSDHGFSEEDVAAYWSANAGSWAAEVRQGHDVAWSS